MVDIKSWLSSAHEDARSDGGDEARRGMSERKSWVYMQGLKSGVMARACCVGRTGLAMGRRTSVKTHKTDCAQPRRLPLRRTCAGLRTV